MAIAAVAASLVLNRTRTAKDELPVKAPSSENVSSSLSLEALRSAGM